MAQEGEGTVEVAAEGAVERARAAQAGGERVDSAEGQSVGSWAASAKEAVVKATAGWGVAGWEEAAAKAEASAAALAMVVVAMAAVGEEEGRAVVVEAAGTVGLVGSAVPAADCDSRAYVVVCWVAGG